jgi:hypothetical protein
MVRLTEAEIEALRRKAAEAMELGRKYWGEGKSK